MRPHAGATGAQHDLSPQKVAEMAASLAAKLEKEPDNVDGWVMLAHTYYALKRFPEAVAAYERAAALAPDNADLLADYADALGAATNSLEGKPTELDRARAEGRSHAVEGAGARRHRWPSTRRTTSRPSRTGSG